MYYLEEYYAPALPPFCTGYANYVPIKNNKEEIKNFDPEIL